VTADARTQVYGDAGPTLTYRITSGSLLNGDTLGGSLTRAAGENVGTYAIQRGTLDNANYAITYVGDFLTIDLAPLTVTADPQAKLHTDPDITDFTFTYDGFATGEDATNLTTEPTCGIDAGVDQSIAGTYPITCSGGVADNYTFVYVDASLVITAVAEPPLELVSVAAEDGWVRESGETTKKGGTINGTSSLLRLGDDALNRQYRSILSFDTSSLPSNAIVTKVTLKITYAGKSGTSAFTTHGNLLIDLKTPFFSTKNLLQKSDFQALATLNKAGIVNKIPASGSVHEAVLNQAALDALNANDFAQLQLRLRFAKDDNNDFGADFLKFYSANSLIADTQPVLIIEYYLH